MTKVAVDTSLELLALALQEKGVIPEGSPEEAVTAMQEMLGLSEAPEEVEETEAPEEVEETEAPEEVEETEAPEEVVNDAANAEPEEVEATCDHCGGTEDIVETLEEGAVCRGCALDMKGRFTVLD